MAYLIFPNQLFELKYYPQDVTIKEIHIIEDPVFFGFRSQKLNFNKLKLVLHRASMKYYEKYIHDNTSLKQSQSQSFKNVKVYYHSFDSLIENPNKKYKPKYSSILSILKKSGLEKEVYTFDLTDHYLESIISKTFTSISFLPNPNFLVTQKQLELYFNKNKSKKTIVQGHFYNWVKEQINILTETKSYDTENRNPLPNNIKIPSLGSNSNLDKEYIKEAIGYITTHKIFSNNCGPSELTIDDCWFPVTHLGSEKWLNKFIKDRLNKFGDYQDAIRDDNQTMFHSLIAPMFNIGLINPSDIISNVMKSKAKIKINNVEGFLRQIIGWREYQRYCYLYYYEKMTKSNIFENDRKLTSSLYEGTTGLPPVDDAIKTAFKTGYLHHIQRLMVMSNIFNLMDISPNESYKWFMEFSLDSYDWLMTQNVYSMGMWADGGLTMRKPYISTAGYVLKMSNYKEPRNLKEGDFNWTEVWRSLFYRKIIQHRKIFEKTPYIFQIKTWDKMKETDKSNLLDMANKFIKEL